MKWILSFWRSQYKISQYFSPCTIPPCRLAPDINLWVDLILIPPKLNFSGDFSQWVMSLISLFFVCACWILSVRLFCSAAIQSLLEYPPDVRYLIRISLNRHNLLHEVGLLAPPSDGTRTHLYCVPRTPGAPDRLCSTNWGAKCLSEFRRATPMAGGTTAVKTHPFQKIWNASVLIFCFLTELTVVF